MEKKPKKYIVVYAYTTKGKMTVSANNQKEIREDYYNREGYGEEEEVTSHKVVSIRRVR